jgi:hypothetical protein
LKRDHAAPQVSESRPGAPIHFAMVRLGPPAYCLKR